MGQRPSDPCDLLDDVEAGDRDRVRAPGQDPPQRAPDVAAPVLGQDRAKRRLRDFGDSTQLTLVGLHPASCCHRQGLLQTHKKKGSELVDLRFGRVAIDEVRARRADAERRGGVAQLGRCGPNFLSRDRGAVPPQPGTGFPIRRSSSFAALPSVPLAPQHVLLVGA